jgi:prolyl oligopeptidase
MSPSDRVTVGKAAETIYTDRFLPAWRKLRAFVAATYAPRARAGIALSAVPHGDDAYALLVRRWTTTSMSPAVIHQTGLDEVKRIEAEMQRIGRELGFDATLQELEATLRADPDVHFDTREDILSFCRTTLKTIEGQLPKLFKRLPQTPLGCQSVPQDRETVWPNFYEGPAGDGRGAFINLVTSQPEGQVRFDKATLILHEGLPGHHLQQSLQTEMRDVPEFRRAYSSSAYVEGWAVYAESLGSELGLYRDPYSRLGRLSRERYWAARLVADTGIHARGWSRRQTEDYFQAHAAAHSLADIDQFIAWPGQALAYTVGGLKLKDLRQRAERALGPRFDVREFHDVVLRNGALPLDLLEQEVDTYIQLTK